MSANPILNLDTIQMLKEVMAEDFQLLLTTFLTDAPKRLDDLRKLLAVNDIAGMERPAHTLKGSSGNLGATALSAACADLVNKIREKNVEHPEVLVAKIIEEYEKVVPLIQSYQTA